MTATYRQVYDSWSGQPSPYGKVPSHMTYSCREGVYYPVKWGHTSSQATSDESSVHVSMFKLLLDPTADPAPPPPVPGLSAGDILADWLRYLKEVVHKKVTRQWQGLYTLDTATWEIAVPSRWSPSSNHTVRQAACMAGLVPRPSDLRLSLLLETEAAALARGALLVGQSLLVVDAGGEGVEATRMRVVEGYAEGVTTLSTDATHRVVVPAKDTVDSVFLRHITTHLGAGAEEAMAAKPRSVRGIMAQWHIEKKGLSLDALEDGLVIEIPSKILSKLSEEMQDQLDEDDGILLSLSDVLSIYKPHLAAVQSAIEEVMAPGLNVDRTVLVGGFFRSQFIMDRAISGYDGRTGAVAHFLDPALAVVLGTYLHAKDPSILVSTAESHPETTPPNMLRRQLLRAQSAHRVVNRQLHKERVSIITLLDERQRAERNLKNRLRDLEGQLQMAREARTVVDRELRKEQLLVATLQNERQHAESGLKNRVTDLEGRLQKAREASTAANRQLQKEKRLVATLRQGRQRGDSDHETRVGNLQRQLQKAEADSASSEASLHTAISALEKRHKDSKKPQPTPALLPLGISGGYQEKRAAATGPLTPMSVTIAFRYGLCSKVSSSIKGSKGMRAITRGSDLWTKLVRQWADVTSSPGVLSRKSDLAKGLEVQVYAVLEDYLSLKDDSAQIPLMPPECESLLNVARCIPTSPSHMEQRQAVMGMLTSPKSSVPIRSGVLDRDAAYTTRLEAVLSPYMEDHADVAGKILASASGYAQLYQCLSNGWIEDGAEEVAATGPSNVTSYEFITVRPGLRNGETIVLGPEVVMRRTVRERRKRVKVRLSLIEQRLETLESGLDGREIVKREEGVSSVTRESIVEDSTKMPSTTMRLESPVCQAIRDPMAEISFSLRPINRLTPKSLDESCSRIVTLFARMVDPSQGSSVPLTESQLMVKQLAEAIYEKACRKSASSHLYGLLLRKLKDRRDFLAVFPDEYTSSDGGFPPFFHGFQHELTATKTRLERALGKAMAESTSNRRICNPERQQAVTEYIWRLKALLEPGEGTSANPLILHEISFIRLKQHIVNYTKREFKNMALMDTILLSDDSVSEAENQHRRLRSRQHFFGNIRFIGTLFNHNFLACRVVTSTCLCTLALQPVLTHAVHRYINHDILSSGSMAALRAQAQKGKVQVPPFHTVHHIQQFADTFGEEIYKVDEAFDYQFNYDSIEGATILLESVGFKLCQAKYRNMQLFPGHSTFTVENLLTLVIDAFRGIVSDEKHPYYIRSLLEETLRKHEKGYVDPSKCM
ncbi:hypothetical protein KIPB_004039 [Kipferlia bialata]|uniref:Uncharacterized protein n=1 Tax=Kipferlia bialata TaxID=797122 RepID=A0A9K3CRW3_9EUKA|nr:hypothetical protein KIPB_001335 [Kipferlia bialata]GIQ82829.1 hypothetical protein KIPB_004039 [Kipferlia bialata]|eukprot:g1335.t1